LNVSVKEWHSEHFVPDNDPIPFER
jgi:hypothetical protein